MTENKTRVEIAQFDTLIAPPDEKEKLMGRQNQLAQQELQQRMGMPPPPQPRTNGKQS